MSVSWEGNAPDLPLAAHYLRRIRELEAENGRLREKLRRLRQAKVEDHAVSLNSGEKS